MENIKNSEQATLLLQNEKILLLPSDTVLGLFGICTKNVINRLNKIKDRTNKPYLILVSSIEQVHELADIPEFCASLLDDIWPGPLTCILKAKKSTPHQMVSQEGTIAVRVPHKKELLAILEKVGPLFSTSANLSGDPIPESFLEIHPNLLQRVDGLFIDVNKAYPQIPSTIIDCVGDKISIIREGIIPRSRIK